MNEIDELHTLKSTVARLEAKVHGMNSATTHAIALVRARRGQRWALWLGAAGLASLPMLGWAAVSLTEFQAGDPIVAADVNTNFSNINAALDGPLMLGTQTIDDVLDDCAGDPCPVANAVVDVETSGGLVRVSLETDPDDDGSIESEIRGYGPSGAKSLLFYLERSGDAGATWERRGVVESNADDGDTLIVPGSAIGFLDRPPAGEWRYRVGLRFSGASNQAVLSGLRLAAREVVGG